MASPPNPVMVHVVTYEYLFCLLSSERLQPPARRKDRGLLSGSCILGTAGHWLQSKKSGHVLSPSSGRTVGESLTPCQVRSHHSLLKGRDHQPKKN
jgi:hypothetical protein